MSIGVGRHESWFEVWGSADETVEFLRKALDAVIAGRYEEFVKGRRTVGRLELRDGPYLFGTTRCSHVGLRSWRLDARNLRALLTAHKCDRVSASHFPHSAPGWAPELAYTRVCQRLAGVAT